MSYMKRFLAFSTVFLTLLAACAAPEAASEAALPTAHAEQPASAAPAPTLPPTPTPSAVPTATPLPTATPIPTPFRMIWIPDTQSVVYDYPHVVPEMGEWLDTEIGRGDVACVLQTGDAVENAYNPLYWEVLAPVLDAFVDRIPFLEIAGNHELSIKNPDYTGFLSLPWISSIPAEQKFADGKGIYTLFNAGGTDFIAIGAGYDAELEAAEWMNDTLRQYSDRVAILLFHGYIQANGEYLNIGKQLFEQVVTKSPNVRLVLCGHVRGKSGFRTEVLDDDGDGSPDRTVAAMMCNYQDAGQDNGQMRILTFSPETRGILVSTYSPVTKRYYRDHTHRSYDFTIENGF